MANLSINEASLDIAEIMMDDAEELKIGYSTLKNGATVIDCGVEKEGGYDAGLLFTEICMGGFGTCSLRVDEVSGIPFAFIDVVTDHPAIACLAAQKAGWQISVDKYFAMGSGPARALALKPKGTYEKIGYEDDFDSAIIALESSTLPDENVAKLIAEECDVDTENVIMLVAPTASVVGSVQVSGRVVEVALFKLLELGYDTTKVMLGTGTAPIAPVMKNDMIAMGSTNDCIIYYGSVYLTVNLASELFEEVPSSKSRDYGKPFYNIFKDFEFDFYKVDPAIFAPASITINDLEKRTTNHYGKLSSDILLKSFGMK